MQPINHTQRLRLRPCLKRCGKTLRKTWDVYRHAKAAVDILGSLGLPKILAASCLGATLIAFLSGFPLILKVLVGIAAFAGIFALAGFGLQFWSIWKLQAHQGLISLNYIDHGPDSGFTAGNDGVEIPHNVEIESVPVRGIAFRNKRAITSIAPGARNVPIPVEFLKDGDPKTLSDLWRNLGLEMTPRGIMLGYAADAKEPYNFDAAQRTGRKITVFVKATWLENPAGSWHKVTFQENTPTVVCLMPPDYSPPTQGTQSPTLVG